MIINPMNVTNILSVFCCYDNASEALEILQKNTKLKQLDCIGMNDVNLIQSFIVTLIFIVLVDSATSVNFREFVKFIGANKTITTLVVQPCNNI